MPATDDIFRSPDAPLHRRPDAGSPIVTTLSYDLVKVLEAPIPPTDGRKWHQVTLADGVQGYADSRVLRNPEDYHACFARIDGAWLVVDFDDGVR